MIRWLAAFLDEGQAAWPMPGRERGFWRAFRDLARHDEEIPGRKSLATLPDDPLRTVAKLLDGVPEAAREALLTRHLAALPGWAGHVKWRAAERGHPYAKAAPATLVDYLAVRLFLADAFGEAPTAAPAPATAEAAAIWLEAWEESWRGRLTTALAAPRPAELPRMPAAQLVFCIDVRSEVFRRHLERTGPLCHARLRRFLRRARRRAALRRGACLCLLPRAADAEARHSRGRGARR
jgi:uncharacterized protein YbcC (UPF0753/DUF2309 family)